MYFGLSQTFFGTPQDGEKGVLYAKCASEAEIFKLNGHILINLTLGAIERPSSPQKDRQANTGSPAMDIGTFFQEPTTSSSSRPQHHVEPVQAPAHSIHMTNRTHGDIYKHPTQHRAVHRHHNAPVGTPEMHLDDIFKEPAWYTSSPGSCA